MEIEPINSSDTPLKGESRNQRCINKKQGAQSLNLVYTLNELLKTIKAPNGYATTQI